jgi:hypothetical protein
MFSINKNLKATKDMDKNFGKGSHEPLGLLSKEISIDDMILL